MRGAGVVSHNQGGGTYESSERRDIGMADEVHRLRADFANRTAETGFAVDTHQNRQIAGML